MFTRSEKTYLMLTLAFLAAGSGIKAWRKSAIRLGPFPDTATLALDSALSVAVALDTSGSDFLPAENTMADGSAAVLVAQADSAPYPVMDPSTASTGSAFPARANTSKDPGKVDLNRADAAALARVKGIGAKTAQAIIEHRRSHGDFRKLRDLLQVKGIGEKKLEKLAPYLIL